MPIYDPVLAAEVVSIPRRRLSPRTLFVPLWLILGVVVLFIATYHLDTYPTIWYDEGQDLHVPQTLLRNGVYADVSSEGFRYFGPTVATGPTVMLPVALAFRIGGIGLLQARIVITIYLLLSIALFAILTRRQYGQTVAILATLLLVASPGIDLILNGRQVLGEVPALAFLLLGILFWWRGTRLGGGWRDSVGAGLAFALMSLTKNDFALVLVPTFVVLYVLDRLYYRQVALTHFLIPTLLTIGGVFVWYLAIFLLALRTDNAGHILALWRNASAGAIFVFSRGRMLSSVKYLLGPDVLYYWGLPALIYGLILARERSPAGVRQAFLVTFAVVGLSWFAFGSIGWPRYAFAPLAILPIFGAKLIQDLVQTLLSIDVRRIGWSAIQTKTIAAALVAVIALTVGNGLQAKADNIVGPHDVSPQLMAAYIDSHVPPSAVIEGWEPELGFLSNRNYHYPPISWLDRAVRTRWLGVPGLMVGYDPRVEAQPSYLVVGPFGKFSGIYKQMVVNLHAPPISSVGQYDLYQLR